MNSDFSANIKKIEEVLDAFLDENFSTEWKNQNFGNLPSGVKNEHFAQLLKPCKELVSLGGKRWRPLFMVFACQLVDKDNTFVYELTPIVEMVHTASLIHDDIEDGADTRRGKPASYITYGLDRSINCASWLYFSAFSVIEKNVKSEKMKTSLYALLSEELRRLHLGQAMDIYWHNNPSVIPTQEEYSAMVRMKTGTLASLAAQCGILCAGGTQEQAKQLGAIASKIGEGFQVIDDIINITTGNAGKKRGDDIVEGKKSLPLILHLQERPQDKDELLECFALASKNGIEDPSVERAISILNSSDCIEKAKQYAVSAILSSCQEICQIYSNNEASQNIQKLFFSMFGE